MFFKPLFVVLLLSTSFPEKLVAQTKISDDIDKRLLLKLNSDSVFRYEINSSWSRGPMYFISFKNNKIRAGYFLPKEYITQLIIPRMLMPKNATVSDTVVFTDRPESRKIGKEIEMEKLRQLPCEIDCNVSEPDTDGFYYTLAFLSKDNSFHRSYYEIYYYFKSCPENPNLVELTYP